MDDSGLAHIDDLLAETDALLSRNYPGTRPTRQPVHTVYLPGDRFGAGEVARWGEQALAAVDSGPGLGALCSAVGVPPELIESIAERVADKLVTEPIEDLRLDFEDGYGDRGDEVEDKDVLRAASLVADAVAAGSAPPFIGIRFKSLEQATRARGIRTLDLFLGAVLEAGPLPDGLRLTLPKVSTVAQVEAMAYLCARLESAHGLSEGGLGFEVQVETPQLVLGANGRSPVAELLHRAQGRVVGLHYGTYDYSAYLGIAGAYQSLEHPAADFAKQVMQVAAAGTGVSLSDGSTNVLPVGDAAAVERAWRLHARLVRRSLERGYYQGWDLHPAQLPTRFIANFTFYREPLREACTRLGDYQRRSSSGFLDEPATARALADFVGRALACGATTSAEVVDLTGLNLAGLAALGRGVDQALKTNTVG